VQTHKEDKPWRCDHPACGKRFKLRVYLDVHKKVHPMSNEEEHGEAPEVTQLNTSKEIARLTYVFVYRTAFDYNYAYR
jgi:hypothetical protein